MCPCKCPFDVIVACLFVPLRDMQTAQALRDITGEDLPLMMFANWRGFSGGIHDMFNEGKRSTNVCLACSTHKLASCIALLMCWLVEFSSVLESWMCVSVVVKFGAFIVDHLRALRQPVFIYLPPNATLHGGAWVVVDPTINSPFLEMYANDEVTTILHTLTTHSSACHSQYCTSQW
jgi:acetyl-CoA carboxylase/biotin carboxylase 1